jgi:NADH-quinone oxidoreductase subunit M
VIGIAYTWRAMQKAFFGAGDRGAAAPASELPAISIPERVGAVILMGTSVAIGLYPQMLLRVIVPALHSSLFDGLWRANGR